MSGATGLSFQEPAPHSRFMIAYAYSVDFCTYSRDGSLQLSSCWRTEPIELIAGFTQEPTLGPSDNHIYTVTLTEEATIFGEADQHGVDLVIDEFGPDGRLIRTVDSPNGTEGPKSIDLTALTTG